jgi:hypothetical protein
MKHEKTKGMFGSSPWLAHQIFGLPKFWLTFLVAHELANIGKKSELPWPKSH